MIFARANRLSESFWSGLGFFALLPGTVATQVYRYRRESTSRESQQTRWVVFGLAICIVGFLLVLVTGQVLLPPALQQSSVLTTFVNGTIIYGFLLPIPISIAMLCLCKDERRTL